MTDKEKTLIERIGDKLPWKGGKEMPKATEVVLCDCGDYGLHADMAIGMWLGWMAVKRWVYRREILTVMRQEGIDPRDYGYKGKEGK